MERVSLNKDALQRRQINASFGSVSRRGKRMLSEG